MRTAEIRRRFLDFFAERGHTVVPSAPLPTPDPTLLFVNAGMVPFKPYLTGEAAAPWPRAASVQKCVRTLDIEEVGRTTRHGSFFQMNGNFSLGDYFKEEAIAFAWELSTNPVAEGGYGLDPDRVWVTVHHTDDESRALWRRISGLPDERIVARGDEDNFWSMGVPGPCGPCSELYYDRGPALGRAGGPAIDEDRYMEFWNLVFMQYERGEGPGKSGYPILGELPRRNIDTGMGLERMATLLQGVDNLYETDETRPVLDRAAELTGARYGADLETDVRLRVVADRVRTALMLLADGTIPGNEGRGYVLRRILRRSVRSMRQLGYTEPVLGDLLAVARDRMAPSYPEVAESFGRIADQAAGEEDAFRATLRQGTVVLDTAVTRVKAEGGRQLPGAQAFLLHDTYGFPIDLTLEMAAEQGVEVDREGFTALMREQRERARADARARKSGGTDTPALRPVLDEHGPTDWRAWDTLTTESRVLALLGPSGPAPVARGPWPARARSSRPCWTAPRSTPSPAARTATRGGCPVRPWRPKSSMCSARCPDWSRIRCGARPASWPRLRPGQTTAARQGRRIAGPGSGRRTADRGPGGDARVPARGAHHGVRARLRVRSAECGAAPDPRSCRKGRNASMTVTAKIDTTRPVATLINVFAVSPDRQSELVALLSHATEQTMRHQPGFVCANFHASQDGERVINYAQWESEQHYRAMLANPEARVHMDQAAEIATDVQPRLFRVESSHTG